MGRYEDLLLQYDQLKRDYEAAKEENAALVAEKDLLEKDIVARLTNIQDQLKLTQEKDAEINDLKKKMRESGAGLLGSTMEIEALQDKIKQKEQELADLGARVEGLVTGGTGILGQLDDCVTIMKEKVAAGKHNIRMVVPTLTDFDQLGFTSLLSKLPPKAVVNLAADFDLEKDKDLVRSLQQQRVVLTRSPAKNEYAVSVDNAVCVIGIVDKKDPATLLGGMFTNVEGLISLFVDAIQTAWVKGFKVPIIQSAAPPPASEDE
ncbi:MAG TPA: hypothetical protein VKK79_16590 [Candidatus Lokiarchaeia archaeon]|nr:hypothetical protein [Candidatus Lokiarchaeia archaeon]